MISTDNDLLYNCITEWLVHSQPILPIVLINRQYWIISIDIILVSIDILFLYFLYFYISLVYLHWINSCWIFLRSVLDCYNSLDYYYWNYNWWSSIQVILIYQPTLYLVYSVYHCVHDPPVYLWSLVYFYSVELCLYSIISIYIINQSILLHVDCL